MMTRQKRVFVYSLTMAALLTGCSDSALQSSAPLGHDHPEEPMGWDQIWNDGKGDNLSCGCQVTGTLNEDVKSLLTSVNRQVSLPKEFQPIVVHSPIQYSSPRRKIHPLVLGYFIAMSEALYENKELKIDLMSGYRGFCEQCSLFASYAKENGEVEANTFSAKAGHSEHQLATTMDIFSGGNFLNGTGPVSLWMQENAHRFGFVMSYPPGTQAKTGYVHEPWHYRYVGLYAAAKLKEMETQLGRRISTHEFAETLSPMEREQLERNHPGDTAHLTIAMRAKCEELGWISTCNVAGNSLIACDSATKTAQLILCDTNCASNTFGVPDTCDGGGKPFDVSPKPIPPLPDQEPSDVPSNAPSDEAPSKGG